MRSESIVLLFGGEAAAICATPQEIAAHLGERAQASGRRVVSDHSSIVGEGDRELKGQPQASAVT